LMAIPVWTTAIFCRFREGRGVALAVMLSGPTIGSSLAPIIAEKVIDGYGWREAYVFLSIFFSLVSLPLVILFFHDKERYIENDMGSVILDITKGVADITPNQALYSVKFWSLAIAALFASTSIMAMIAHFVPMVTQLGL